MTYKTKDVIKKTTIVLMLVILFLSIAIEALDAGLGFSSYNFTATKHAGIISTSKMLRQASVDFCHRCGMAE